MYESLCSPPPLGVKAEVSLIFWGGNKTDCIELEKNRSRGIRRVNTKHKYKLPVQRHALSQICSRGDEMSSNPMNQSVEKHLLTPCEMKCSQESTRVLLTECPDKWNMDRIEWLFNTLKFACPHTPSSPSAHLHPWGKASWNEHMSAHRILPLVGVGGSVISWPKMQEWGKMRRRKSLRGRSPALHSCSPFVWPWVVTQLPCALLCPSAGSCRGNSFSKLLSVQCH